MLRLASALARLLSKDPNSPTTSRSESPVPRKPSIKSKPSWRSASVHADNRPQNFKCPFSATNALTAVTKREINSYNSTEEIRPSITLSTDRINHGKEVDANYKRAFNRRSLGIKLEENKEKETLEEAILETTNAEASPDSELACPESEGIRKSSLKKSSRKMSCTVALDVYRRRGSNNLIRPRLNSLSIVSCDKLNYLKEKFSTPEKVMHFFGRCFVKFFSNYG